MLKLRLLLALLFASFALPNVGLAKSPSPAMISILRERLRGDQDLRLRGMIRLDWEESDLRNIRNTYPMEVYRLRNPNVAADYLSYTIYRFRTEPRYLIVRSGGLQGAFEVFATPVR